MLSKRLQGVHVWVGTRRAEQVENARDAGATIAILDDGFQHRQLHRDLNILLVEPAHLHPGARLFPEGVLVESAARADLLGGLDEMWRESDTSRLDFTFEMVPTHLATVDGERLQVETVSGKRVCLLAGIANPNRFQRTVTRLGASVVDGIFFRDHHRFTLAELEEVARRACHRGADFIVTTEKDWARMDGLPRLPDDKTMVLCVSVSFKKGLQKLDEFLAKCCV